MFETKLKSILASAIMCLTSLGANAEACGSGDLANVSFINCIGYQSGNLINTSPADLTHVKSIFTSLGYSNVSTQWLEKIDNLRTNNIDFNTAINGTYILGVHKGGGAAEGTAFYVISGQNVNEIKYQLTSLSNAAIYSTLPVSAVPEPSTNALMLAGLAAVGFVAKRRKKLI